MAKRKFRYATIDHALAILTEAKRKMGGDRSLILSLTDSEIEDANVDDLVIVNDDESHYVEVRVAHPALPTRAKFKNIPIGTLFQTRDGRVHESFTWVGLVKVSDTECSRLMASPIRMPALTGDVPVPNACPVRDIVVTNLRLDGTQYGGTPMRKSSKKEAK